MNRLMYLLAPKGAFGFAIRLLSLVGLVALLNLLFSVVYDPHQLHEARYYISHAVIVGGPLIAFFLTVTVFQIELQRKLWRLARKDGLTALDNRRAFFDETSKRRASKCEGVLLMLDADNFKDINDTHGHQIGDRCLKRIAQQLRRNLRSHDVVGRIGGEEFAIYVQGATLQEARAIGHRLAEPLRINLDAGAHIELTLSVGAVIDRPHLSLDEMCNYADKALYWAKSNGRAQLAIWDESMSPIAQSGNPDGTAALH